MKKFVLGIWIIALLTGIAVSVCQAETAYVSDLLILTFREGPGTNYTVIKTLKSNTPLSIIEEKDGFYKVSLTSGEVGWVDKQFVMFETPKALIITKLEQEKSALEDRIKQLEEAAARVKEEAMSKQTSAQDMAAELKEQVATLQKENKQLSRDLKQSKSEFTALKQASMDVTGTLSENKRLKAENAELSKNINQLENDTRNMFRTGMIKWFLAGFGVLLFGWIIGKSVSPKKRRQSSLLG